MSQYKYAIRLFLTAVIIIVGLNGCIFKKRDIFSLEQITEYMGRKYNDTFTVRGTDLQSPFDDKTLLALYSENLGVIIKVDYQSENHNIEEALTDNYMSYVLKPDIEALLQPMAEEIYGEVKVCYVINSNPFCDPLGPETTADQLLSSGEIISHEDAYASANSKNYNDYLVPEYRLLRCDHMVSTEEEPMEWRT